MKAQAVALALGVLSAAPALAADTYSVDKDHSQVTFQVKHLFSKTRGRFNDFTGTINLDEKNLEASTVELHIQAASIDTDNPKRDDHLRSPDFFDVEKNPEITFKSEKIRKLEDGQFEVTGAFTMHGITKTIVLPVTYGGSGKDPWGNTKAGFATETVLNRKDYGLLWNAKLDNGGYLLGDDVWINVEIEALKTAAPVTN